MKIEIVESTVCDTKRVKVGDIVDATIGSARFLIAIKKAKEYIDTPQPKKKPESKSKKKVK